MDNGWAPYGTYIEDLNKHGFEGMEPRELARYLAHFSANTAAGAHAALLKHGESIMPLAKELTRDTHPFIRASGVSLLSGIAKLS